SAFMSRELGTICRSAPIGLPQSADYLALRDEPKLKKCLVRLEMNKLADKLGLGSVRSDPAADTAHTAPPAATRAEWISAAAVPDDAVICYCAASNTLYAASGDSFLKIPYFDELLRGVRGIVIHDAKSFYHSVHIGFEPQIKCDTMLAAYLISPEQSDYELTRYAMQYDIAKPDGQDEEARALFALNVTGAMYRDLSEKLHEFHQQQLLETIEIPLCYTLYRMESAGFAVDRENIIRFGEELQKTAEELQSRIFELIGYEFNLNSPKQLGEALFEKLGLPSGKKTKTGYSTSAEVLEGLRYQSDAVEYLLRYRAVSKLKSTYCDGLVPQIDGAGRIHSTLKQTETRTGRISSAEPNLQNIPVRTELGRQMRRYFTAGDGRVLVDADYSQIELRVLAAAANDETMIDAFMSGEDIHAVTASQVFNVPLEAMTADLRSKAKAVNFGIVYGIGAFSLSKDIHVSVAEAKRYIDGYLSTYHGVRDYLGRLVESARETGYAETLFGRRRYLPELSSSNHNLRAFGERVAKNMPIQGTAADIIKIAMIHVDRRLEREYPSARLIMQVHDELIVECLESDRDAICTVLKEEMENAAKLAVPMIADVHSGKTWFDAK
ncbi:MAG: DNA polymerase, partial [Acutalibacteraceae bacterium]